MLIPRRHKKIHSAESIYNDYVVKLLKDNPKYKSSSYNGRTSSIIYEFVFDDEGNKTKKIIITYRLFKLILSTYNKKSRTKLLNGAYLNLLNGLGYLHFRCIERNPRNPVIDWGESNKLKELLIKQNKFVKGKTKWLVYFSDESYVKLGWMRGAIKNKSVFDFEMAGSNTTEGTFVYETIKTIRENPFLKTLYKFYPYKPNNK